MRTIHCTKCGHKDEIEDRRPMFEQPLEVLPVHELREVIEQARFSAKRAA